MIKLDLIGIGISIQTHQQHNKSYQKRTSMREAPSGNHWNFIVQHSIIIHDEKGRTLLGFRLSAVPCAIRTGVPRNGVWEPFTEAKKKMPSRPQLRSFVSRDINHFCSQCAKKVTKRVDNPLRACNTAHYMKELPAGLPTTLLLCCVCCCCA